MKICVLSTIDCRGGAANVAWELRNRLKQEGHTVSTFVRYKYSNEPDVFVIPRFKWQDKCVKLFANDLRFGGSIFHTKEYQEADIVHCHNLHSNFFNLKDLIRMSKEKKVIWTLHDMWAFTGFAYNSITLKNPNPKKFLLFLWDNTPNLLRAKKEIYKKSNLIMVAVSHWLKNEAVRELGNTTKVVTIYNGIDIRTFKPLDKKNLRIKYGLPLDKKIIGCGIKGWIEANSIIDTYKNRQDLYFVALGHNNIKTTNTNFKALPQTSSRGEFAEYLNCLDILMHPTPEEAFGLLSAEAMACGVPVVTHDVDAMSEVALGYIGDNIPSGIEKLLQSDLQRLGVRCIEKIHTQFSSDKMYAEYKKLYEETLSQKKDTTSSN